jgi:hypothetical protein
MCRQSGFSIQYCCDFRFVVFISENMTVYSSSVVSIRQSTRSSGRSRFQRPRIWTMIVGQSDGVIA